MGENRGEWDGGKSGPEQLGEGWGPILPPCPGAVITKGGFRRSLCAVLLSESWKLFSCCQQPDTYSMTRYGGVGGEGGEEWDPPATPQGSLH